MRNNYKIIFFIAFTIAGSNTKASYEERSSEATESKYNAPSNVRIDMIKQRQNEFRERANQNNLIQVKNSPSFFSSISSWFQGNKKVAPAPAPTAAPEEQMTILKPNDNPSFVFDDDFMIVESFKAEPVTPLPSPSHAWFDNKVTPTTENDTVTVADNADPSLTDNNILISIQDTPTQSIIARRPPTAYPRSRNKVAPEIN